MTLETWLAFILASLILTMTPGPSILLGVVHSLNFGVKKTVYTALGDISANFLQMILVAIGLGVIIASSELAFQIIKWFGVITLLYMGLKMFFSKPTQINNTSCENMSKKKMFTSGFIVAAGNPKAIIFFTAFFPQFIDPQQSLFLQMSILCPTMAFLDFTWVMIYAFSANKFFDKFQSNASYINKFGGSALIGASGFLAMSSKSNS